MDGNVWEWCGDVGSEEIDLGGLSPDRMRMRVARGGSFSSSADECGSEFWFPLEWHIHQQTAKTRRKGLGLRLVLRPPAKWDSTPFQTLPEMMDALNDSHIYSRLCALGALDGMGASASDAVPAVIKALADKIPDVRTRAAKALGNIGHGGMDVLNALFQAARERSVSESCIVDSLEKLAGSSDEIREAIARFDGQDDPTRGKMNGAVPDRPSKKESPKRKPAGKPKSPRKKHKPKPKPSNEIFTNRVGMTFVYVPPGELKLKESIGGPDGKSAENEFDIVVPRGFHLQTTPVNRKHWKTVMGQSPAFFPRKSNDCPVDMVPPGAATKLIQKLNELEGVGACDIPAYRIPTETELDYAEQSGLAEYESGPGFRLAREADTLVSKPFRRDTSVRGIVSPGRESNVVRAGEIEFEINQEQAVRVMSMAFSPDSRSILAATGKNTRLWDLQTATPAGLFEGGFPVARSPDGKCAQIGKSLWDMASGREMRAFETHMKYKNIRVFDTAFSADGHHIALGCSDATLVFDIGKNSGSLVKHMGFRANYVGLSPDGRFLSTVNGSVHAFNIWDIREARKINLFRVTRYYGRLSRNLSSAAFNRDSRYAILGWSNGGIQLWEPSSTRKIRSFEGHADAVLSLSFSSGGEFILSGSMDRTIRLWDVDSGEEIRTFERDVSPVWFLEFGPNGKMAASAGEDKCMKLWDIASGTEICRFYTFSDESWIILTPEGYYNASPAAERFMTVRAGKAIRGTNQYKERYCRPGIIRKKLCEFYR